MAAPYLAKLTLADFRSYGAAEVVAGPGVVVVTGENGSGKTNLLEAVSLLSAGRGLRGVTLSEMARTGGGGGFSLAATLETEGGSVEVGTGTLAAAPDRRVLRINGAAAPVVRLGEWLSLLWVTPAMDRLFADPPSARRRFLDRLVLALDPGHARQVTRYDAGLRARARLLADDAAPDPTWLTSLERGIAEHGIAVAAARAATVAALADVLADAPAGPFARAGLALAGWEATDADALAAALATRRSIDAAAGRATVGPHRVDLVVTHLGKDRAAAQSSTGEQKALLLGIVLAHADLVAARTGARPILLLDEVAAHLDAARRAALFERLADSGAQAWLTGTDRALFEPLGTGATHLEVAGGGVH